MSLVKSAIDAVMTALSGVAPVVDRVRLRPLPKSNPQAVTVRPVQAEAVESLMQGAVIHWAVVVAVECYARSESDPDGAVDGLVSDVYSRLMTDVSLGGAVVQVQPQAVVYDFDVDGEKTACATLTFLIRQRSSGAVF